MKFPVSVAKKHPQKNSESEENEKNNENIMKSSEINEPPSLLQIPKSLQALNSSEIDCDHSKENTFHDNENTLTDKVSKMSDEENSRARRPSQEDEGVGSCTHEEEEGDDEEPDTETDIGESRTHLFRRGSIYDDSGCNSSASEDKDDVLDTLNVIYDEDDEGNDSDSSSLFTSDSGISIKRESISERLNPITNTTTESLNSIFKSISPKNVGLSSVGSSSTSRHSSRSSNSINRQTSQSSNSTSVTSRTPATPRSRVARLTRRRRADHNNNDTGPSVYSYLGKAPFKLGDCFKDQGLLSLIACIIYTLILVCIFSAFGLILDIFKSAIGKQEIKEMRENIISARRRRTVGHRAGGRF